MARHVVATGGAAVVRPINWYSGFMDAFMGLSTLSKKRSEAYANANATVSLPNLAASLGLEHVSDITPAAMEVLVQIDKHLTRDNGMSIRMLS